MFRLSAWGRIRNGGLGALWNAVFFCLPAWGCKSLLASALSEVLSFVFIV